MSFISTIRKSISDGHNHLSRQVGRFKNKRFMQATVAVCAQVALADGVVSNEEKQKMMTFLQQSEELRVFETKVVIAFFQELVTAYEFDAEIGKGEAMKHILAIKDEPEMAQLAIRVGIAIGKSDGSFDDEEKAVLKEITTALGLNPAEFDL